MSIPSGELGVALALGGWLIELLLAVKGLAPTVLLVENLIDWLDALNRKERFFLMKFALGVRAAGTDSAFRSTVGGKIGLTIPPDCRWWIDYHLDWLYAALVLKGASEPPPVSFPSPGFISGVQGTEPFNVNTNQEDTDLLLAFEHDGDVHLVLIEAKGDTAWTNKQIASKARRLRLIFGEDGQRYSGVVPHFVITSPRPTQKLSVSGLPEWMAPGGSVPWIKLPTPEKWTKIQRCDPTGSPTAKGSHWRVRPPSVS
jgi:hypothetical protein